MPKLTNASIKQASLWLIDAEPRFEPVFQAIGPLKVAQKPNGFEGLFQSIVSQQLSVQAARTIWQRLHDAGLTQACAIRQSKDETLRALGLSAQKIRYGRALAAANVDYRRLEDLSTEDVIDTLTPILGIGRWTAQMYALFTLRHSDVFAGNDLGLQQGLKHLFELDARPSPSEALAYAEAWSPWRSVASLALWAWHTRVA